MLFEKCYRASSWSCNYRSQVAGGATFMSEEPDILGVPSVPVVIVSATVIPSVAIIVFIIVGVLPIALLLSCPPCPWPDRRRERLACCRGSLLSLLLKCPLFGCHRVCLVLVLIIVVTVWLVAFACRCRCCQSVRSSPLYPPFLCRSPLPSRCLCVNTPLLVVMPLKSRRSDCTKMKTPVWSQAK